MIEEKEGIPPAQQRLIFGGKVMTDDKTVEDYNITPGTSLHMIFYKHIKDMSVRLSDMTEDYFKQKLLSLEQERDDRLHSTEVKKMLANKSIDSNLEFDTEATTNYINKRKHDFYELLLNDLVLKKVRTTVDRDNITKLKEELIDRQEKYLQEQARKIGITKSKEKFLAQVRNTQEYYHLNLVIQGNNIISYPYTIYNLKDSEMAEDVTLMKRIIKNSKKLATEAAAASVNMNNKSMGFPLNNLNPTHQQPKIGTNLPSSSTAQYHLTQPPSPYRVTGSALMNKQRTLPTANINQNYSKLTLEAPLPPAPGVAINGLLSNQQPDLNNSYNSAKSTDVSQNIHESTNIINESDIPNQDESLKSSANAFINDFAQETSTISALDKSIGNNGRLNIYDVRYIERKLHYEGYVFERGSQVLLYANSTEPYFSMNDVKMDSEIAPYDIITISAINSNEIWIRTPYEIKSKILLQELRDGDFILRTIDQG